MENFKHYPQTTELDTSWQRLIALAIEKLPNAYAPYSNFLVSAALLMDDDTIVFGTNQENAAYPSGLCAERVAVFAETSYRARTSQWRLVRCLPASYARSRIPTATTN